ncbi:MAG TPA: amidohydrolase family protein [Lunatimonas sp.]|nr:amidohydrolase family protein [Lunatimonas sp.]
MDKRSFIKTCLVGGLAVSAFPRSLVGAVGKNDSFIPIVDTHLHLWDRGLMEYPWLSPPLDRNFLPSDYKEATDGLPISKMVFVECGRIPEQYLVEIDWVVQQAKIDPRIMGMVAYFPLEKGNKGQADLEQLLERKIVRSIRRGVNAELMKDRSFLEGVALMDRFGLNYDLNISPPQMEDALVFVRKFPNIQFILNHICNPSIKDGEWESWKKGMTLFAELDHVTCKISGMITKTDPAHWEISDLKPYADHILEVFSPDKMVFGGDWPVVTRAGTFKQWMSAFLELTVDLTVAEKEKIYHENAERIYRI